jgi:hypothetical protein
VASLVELLGVERQAETDGGAGVELGAVGKGRDTAVVDLGLQKQSVLFVSEQPNVYGILTLAKLRGSSLYLLASSRPEALLA